MSRICCQRFLQCLSLFNQVGRNLLVNSAPAILQNLELNLSTAHPELRCFHFDLQ